MSTVHATVQIAAPPERVWEVVMDPLRLDQWVTIHRRLRKHDEGPAGIGYCMDQQIHLRGVSLEVRWTLVEYERGKRAVWEGHGPARSHARTEYVLTACNGGAGTRFEYHNEFHAPLGPIGALASRALVGGMPEREAEHTLQRLRKLLEQDG